MDWHYPRYHLRPALNWVNDPNGMIYFKGRYHVFMQYNPFGPLWGNIHWLHYSSADLVQWKNHGLALSPDLGYDQGGCWSGCAVLDDGLPVLIYSADDGQQRLPAIAYGDETALHFTKDQDNPVISSRPMTGIHGFRDHKVFRWRNTWVQLIGSGNDSQGMIFCYQSLDLKSWKYLGLWFEYPHPLENMLECPDLFVDGEHVIQIFSTNSPSEDRTCQSYYRIGRILEEAGIPRFESITGYHLDFDRMYAPQILQDDKRILLLGWVREDRADEAIVKAGWAGAMSLPRQLQVDEITNSKGELQILLRMYPAEELQQLRRAEFQEVGHEVADLISQAEFQFHYNALEIQDSTAINWRLTEQGRLVLDVAIETDHGRGVIIQGNKEKHVDFRFIPEGDLTIHIFVDHSIVEMFVNYSCCITFRIYPDNPIDGMTLEPYPSKIKMWQLSGLIIEE